MVFYPLQKYCNLELADILAGFVPNGTQTAVNIAVPETFSLHFTFNSASSPSCTMIEGFSGRQNILSARRVETNGIIFLTIH